MSAADEVRDVLDGLAPHVREMHGLTVHQLRLQLEELALLGEIRDLLADRAEATGGTTDAVAVVLTEPARADRAGRASGEIELTEPAEEPAGSAAGPELAGPQAPTRRTPARRAPQRGRQAGGGTE
jgi:hypothetical protein